MTDDPSSGDKRPLIKQGAVDNSAEKHVLTQGAWQAGCGVIPATALPGPTGTSNAAEFDFMAGGGGGEEAAGRICLPLREGGDSVKIFQGPLRRRRRRLPEPGRTEGENRRPGHFGAKRAE